MEDLILTKQEKEHILSLRKQTREREKLERLGEVLVEAYLVLDKCMPGKENLKKGKMGLSDDGLDYLHAAVTNSAKLLNFYLRRDLASFSKWLEEPLEKWLACDGEIRYDLKETKKRGDF